MLGHPVPMYTEEEERMLNALYIQQHTTICQPFVRCSEDPEEVMG